MDEPQALAAFVALGHEHRLRLVRSLVTAGPSGLASGALAVDVGVSASTVSFHLKELEHAGLVQSRREGRSIVYSAAFPALSDLIQFLMKDCCQGRPEVCAPAITALTLAASQPEKQPVPEPVDVIIYHNPACGTSRNTLSMIRNAGVEPHVVAYLKSPPTRALIKQLLARAGLSVRELLRERGTPYAELGLGDQALTDEQLLDAIGAHPILMNRPLVVSSKGVRLCRPSEVVLDLLAVQQGAFVKEDGERVIDEHGRRVGTA